MTNPVLVLHDVHTYIAQHHILQGVSLAVQKGQPTVLLGRNGAGKSSTLRAIMGLTPATSGRILFDGRPIQAHKTHDIARLGIGFVAEDNAVFFNLTVEENIRLSVSEKNDRTEARVGQVFDLFPDLKKFWKIRAGLLSGGQKQMLAIARALVTDHKMILIDEPSKGLAPIVVEQLGESLLQIKDHTTIILVEQNIYLAAKVGEAYFILDDGQTVHSGLMEDLEADRELKKRYLGIG